MIPVSMDTPMLQQTSVAACQPLLACIECLMILVPLSYTQVISAVTPRPVGFVSTQSRAGVVNLSPYDYFNVMSHNPPTLALGIGRSILHGGVKKETLTNIEETK